MTKKPEEIDIPDYGIKQFCEELNQYLKIRFKYKQDVATCNANTVMVYNKKKCHLYLRFKSASVYWGSDTLVIALIAFSKIRRNHGAHLLYFFTTLPKDYGIKKIGIEVANENASAFAKALGFHEFTKSCWIIDIADLKISLDRFNFKDF